MPPNPFLPLLEGTQEGALANFMSRLPGGLPLSQFNFGRSLFAPTFDRFAGEIGGRIRSGQTPDLMFDDFLNSFDVGRMFRREQPQDTSHLTSPARFLF